MRPRLVGILNVTRDSFSDGGRYLSPDDAIAHARELSAAGADLVELGPASSHPDAEKVSPGEEIERLAGVIDGLDGIPWGVDSYHPETQRYAAARGAAYLNDIQGFPDPRWYDELAGLTCQLVVMHSVQRVGPATRVRTEARAIWPCIEEFFDERIAALEAAGIKRDRLILDPGLGYFLGSTPEPSLAVLGNLSRLRARYDLPVLVSPSRKSFLRTLTGTDLTAIGPATLAAELYAATQGADFIRTHDPAASADALIVLASLTGASRSSGGRDLRNFTAAWWRKCSGKVPGGWRRGPAPVRDGRGPAWLGRGYLIDFRAKSSVTGVPASSFVVRVWGL